MERDASAGSEKSILIRDVTIVDTRDGSLAPNMDVLVTGSRIGKIGASGSIQAVESARTVPASGKYLVPGFLDMHAHAMFSDALPGADRGKTFKLMVAHGITGFREMAGSEKLLSERRILRKEIETGSTIAPEPLIMPGEIINIFPGQALSFFQESGVKGSNPSEAATQEVMRQKEYGADFIKIVNVNREAFFAVQDAARNAGLHVAGHLNPVVSATEASNAGLRAIEHMGPLLSILVDCSSAEETIRKVLTAPLPAPPPSGPPGPAMIRRIVANPTMLAWSRQGVGEGLRFAIKTYSEEKGRALAKTFVRNGTWQVPTLIRIRTMQISDDPIYRNDPNLKYVPPETRAMWMELTEAYIQTAPADTKEAYKELYDQQLRLVKLLKEEGVKMLAGSDMTGIYCIPGFSLHREFRELSKAGLSALEILQMTTLNGAEFLKAEATMGTVDEGKWADLVLLDANPVESAANLEKIDSVVLKGRYFPRIELARMKNDVEDFCTNGQN